MNTSSSGFLPPAVVDAIKGELINSKARDKYVFAVEYHMQSGVALEVRVRGRETLHVVALTS